ncbi:prepilin peptidase [Vibrio sp. D449a]|uniref:prepilin peptidase n=1 Tax=unclassified Vibrio TaxID=2614977 RepID=UPI00358E992D
MMCTAFMTSIFAYSIIFIIGSTLYSFLQCISERIFIYKWPILFSLISSSRCDLCGHKLSIKEYFPLLSTMYLRGKSRCCHRYLDKKYLYGEIISGALLCTGVYLLRF